MGTEGYGDVWTWVAIDADSKLVPTFLVGERTVEDGYAFMSDLRDRVRTGNRIQLTTDGLGIYTTVVDAIWRNGVDFAQGIKEYKGATGDEARRYSPASCSVIEKRVVTSRPTPR